MRKTLLFMLLMLVSQSCAIGASTITWTGQKPQNWREIVSQLARTSWPDEAGQLAADSVKRRLVDLGFFDARVTQSGDTLNLTTGKQYRLLRLTVLADSTHGQEWNGPFTQANMDSAMSGLLTQYYAAGYFYARAIVAGLQRQEAGITVTVSVNRGPCVTIGELRYLGLSRTKSSLLNQTLPPSQGDTLTPALLEDIEQAATALDYVTFQPPIIVKPRLGYTQADLELHFAERQQFLFSGGAGYTNDQSTGLVWNLAMQVQNLFGEGRQLSIKSERREKRRNLLIIAYRQPSTLVGIGSMHGELSTRDYRDQFYEFALNFGYDLQVSSEVVTGLALGWRRVEPNVQAGYSRADATVSLSRTQLDSPANPNTGYAVATSIGYSYRRYSTDSVQSGKSFNDTRALLKLDLYRKLIPHFVGHASIGYRGLETKDGTPPISELLLVGGPGTIRGYRNEQFAARRVAFGSLEPRFRFTGGFMFSYVDVAFIQQPGLSGNVAMYEDTHFGYGLGLSLTDNLRAVKLSAGWNPDISFGQPWVSIEFSSGL